MIFNSNNNDSANNDLKSTDSKTIEPEIAKIKPEKFKSEIKTGIPFNLPIIQEAVSQSENTTDSDNNQKLNLRVEKLNPEAKLPQKAHPEDAGFDLYANDYYSIPAYGQALVQTGIKLAIPQGFAGLIWDKSGLAMKE